MIGAAHRGSIAGGDATTVAVAANVLRAGGNAFDAAIAGIAAACIAEPVLASLGAGGYLLARPAGAAPMIVDFFCQTPGRHPEPGRREFYPVHADFGVERQEFHIGAASIAVPGLVAGLFHLHRRWGRVPMAELLRPAADLARRGHPLSPLQAIILAAVAPIFRQDDAVRARFDSSGDPDFTLQAGEVLRLPGLADLFEALAREGPGLFYRGEVALALAALAGERGGAIDADDLAAYRVIEREPIARRLADAMVFTNAAPSAGGPLIAFALDMLARSPAPDSIAGARRLVGAMAASGEARHAVDLFAEPIHGAARLAEPDLVAHYRRALKQGGTTHLSIADAAGNAAALSVSNGEGCGRFIPGTEVMANNMLGEEDLNPGAFFRWAPDTRVASMMAPSLVLTPDGAATALGSGGSNRIRSAILQVLWRRWAGGLALDAAIEAPRVHLEKGRLHIEDTLPAEQIAALRAGWPDAQLWPTGNFFFGGVHAAAWGPDGGHGAGDPRRGGIAELA